MEKKKAYLIVNFGGPRDLGEVEEFLVCLFRDQEVLRTPLPAWLHAFIFTRLAKKRAKTVVHDYALIGGKSPIYEDTEAIARQVSSLIEAPILTFHRYLPRTHAAFIQAMRQVPEDAEIHCFPLFAQFSYATTGSIATWFSRHLAKHITDRMRWVKSYAGHASYIDAFAQCIRECMQENTVNEERTILLFSAHGLPQEFIRTGDIYESECQLTFKCLSQEFPKAHPLLCYQSQLGKKEWIRPYTADLCHSIGEWGKDYDTVVIVPLSFTSDHIETLFEIEQQYIPPIAAQGFRVVRCPALNQRADWLEAIARIWQEEGGLSTQMMMRNCNNIQMTSV
jgi:protoporphyrin/coproporphyrin ferrochelatase